MMWFISVNIVVVKPEKGKKENIRKYKFMIRITSTDG